MTLHYSIPPHLITLRHFFDLTKERKMLPSRVMLQQNMEERFAQLSKLGIVNLADLLKTLGSKEKLEKFARHAELPVIADNCPAWYAAGKFVCFTRNHT